MRRRRNISSLPVLLMHFRAICRKKNEVREASCSRIWVTIDSKTFRSLSVKATSPGSSGPKVCYSPKARASGGTPFIGIMAKGILKKCLIKSEPKITGLGALALETSMPTALMMCLSLPV